MSLNSLNDKQQHAVRTESKRVLVLAGAGSGKTKTLIQKILYLNNEKGIPPSSILAITFTKNAANEMLDRMIEHYDSSGSYARFMKGKNSLQAKEQRRKEEISKSKALSSLKIMTFHSLCYKLLKNDGVAIFDNQFKIISNSKDKFNQQEYAKYSPDKTSYELFHEVLISLCEERDFLLRLKKFILDYYVDRIDGKSMLVTLEKGEKMYTTLNGTKVRSKSEQFIADWFFRHSIGFEYEPVVKVDFSMKPDFFIPSGNFYIEHVSDKSFPMKAKEEQYEKGGLHVIKTFESMMNDSAKMNHILDQIVKNRISSELIQNQKLIYKEEFSNYNTEVKRFIVEVESGMDMMKGEGIELEEVLAKASLDQHERVRLFWSLAGEIIKEYKRVCTNKSYLDFNDLNIRGLELLKSNSSVRNKWAEQFRYVLVDEFQDVNRLQVQLLNELLNEDSQLFCVGDDWQSIYGFRGSDVSYIVNFEEHFKGSEIIKLDFNYRSTDHIVGASNEVIRNNKFKVEKEVKAARSSEHKITVYSGVSEESNIGYCLNKVKELLTEGYSNDDILFLYRRSAMSSNYFKAFKDEGLKFNGKTIHASKGLEASCVFVLGMTDGSGGFPDVWNADRIFQVIKNSKYELLLEEERRLFYVAITRAKDQLFLISEKGAESSFLKEIPEIYLNPDRFSSAGKLVGTKVCIKCGASIQLKDIFCSQCGVKLN